MISLRSHRLFGIALFDLILSMIGMIFLFLLAWKFYFPNLDWKRFIIAAILLTIPVGITFHVLFGINTKLNSELGLSNKPT